MIVETVLQKNTLSVDDIVTLLSAQDEDKELLFKKAAEVKTREVGDIVYYRGLIEFSNICSKNCYYCGIRKDNSKVKRYNISDEEIIQAAKYAFDEKFASVVLQSGERQDYKFVDKVDNLIRRIKDFSMTDIGITLSCGEQKPETYEKWYRSGAHRYLLRIETTNEFIYQKIHPHNYDHDFDTRKRCLQSLQDLGYQTGTGIMIGLPFQNLEDIAYDLKFMEEFDIDMCGMGPYIEHGNTPLYEERHQLWSLQERFELTLKCIAILRIMMKDINIVASTALQAIDKRGREKGLRVGANIIMPNITPVQYRDSYLLYDNKPCTDENPEDCKACLETRIKLSGSKIGYGEWGDSKHYYKRIKKYRR